MTGEARPFRPIPPSGYIIGNPVRGKRMFFGREDNFKDVARRLEAEKNGIVILFVGGRRSGKTSIMFQIAEGRLGDEFLPVFVDMQQMAGLDSDAVFLERVARLILERLDDERLPIDYYSFNEVNPIPVFDKLLEDLGKLYPDKRLILLVDEAEILRDRVAGGELSSALLMYFSSILESRRVSFCLTGSTGLGTAEDDEWRRLMAKGETREITFLSTDDAERLIREPVEGYVDYGEGVVESIYRLTHGHPYYTQIFCVNIIDYLTNQQRNSLKADDLQEVVRTIIDNTPPQLSYDWDQLDGNQQIALSLLSDESGGVDEPVAADRLLASIKEHKYPLDIRADGLHVALESLFESKVLERDGQGRYRFLVDLYRQWVQRARPVWRLVGEDTARPKKRWLWAGAAAAVVFAAGLGFWGLGRTTPEEQRPQRPSAPVVGDFLVQPTPGTPSDVQVLVDGAAEKSGIPHIVRREAGTYVIETRRVGYYPRRDTLEFEAGVSGTLEISLQRVLGGLRVTSPDPGAQVEVTGEVQRSGPAPLEALDLPTGAYAVRVSGPGYVARQETVLVADERTLALDYDLVRRIGGLYVESTPAGARILLRGEDSGRRTPALLEGIAVGRYPLTLRLPDHYDSEHSVSVHLGRTDTLLSVLRQVPATIQLRTTPADAVVLLDGRQWRRTPVEDSLEAGRYRLRIELEGYGAVDFEQELAPGGAVRRDIVLEAEYGQVRIVRPPFGRLIVDGGREEHEGALGDIRLQTGRHRLQIVGKDEVKEVIVKKDSVHKVLWE